MRCVVIMAQITSIFTTLTVLSMTYLLFCSVRSDLTIAPGTTYDELYTTAIDYYNNEKWEETVFYMEHAINEFKFYRVKLAECRVKCNKLGRTSLPDKNPLNELRFFQALFKKAACLKTCKSAKLGDRPDRISEEATNKFLTLMPYSYLQFAYYKRQMYYKAQCAAHTFLKAHPHDDVMKNNLNYYYNAYGAQNKTIVDLEERLHQKYFLEASDAHEAGNYSGVIELMEKALKYYWWADEECRALCEGQYDSRQFLDLYESIAGHYAHTIYCKEHCDTVLSTMDGKLIEHYLPMHYSYLQFAYYNENKVKDAVDCAATYLLLKPDDEDMENNMVFYEEQMGVSKYQIRVRPKAQSYWNRRELEKEILQFAKTYFWQELEDEDVNEGDYGEAAPIDPSEVHLKEGVKLKMMDEDDEDEEDDEEDEDLVRRSKRGDVGSMFELGQDEQNLFESMVEMVEEETETIDGEDATEEDFEVYDYHDYEEEPEEDEEYDYGRLDEDDYYDYDDEDEELDDNDYFEPERPEVILRKKEREGKEQESMETKDPDKTPFYEIFRTIADEDKTAVVARRYKERMAKLQEPKLPRGPSRRDYYREDLKLLYRPSMTFDLTKQMASEISRVPYPSLAGITLHRDPEALKGKERVAVDGMADGEECQTLMQLVSEEAVYGDGYKGRTQPLSEHEKFEGITVKDAVAAAAETRVPLFFPAMYIYLAERSRAFVQKFFGLSSHLYFSFTHLVCRQAKEGSPSNRSDLSHPVHADNCVIDHELKECRKEEPAFTWRDYSSVLYLNDDFIGGNFMFADFDNTSQVEVEPKCGRLVAFAAGELHGVQPVLKGQRCALAMWYTLDPLHQELDMVSSWLKIESLLKEQEGKTDKEEDYEEIEEHEEL